MSSIEDTKYGKMAESASKGPFVVADGGNHSVKTTFEQEYWFHDIGPDDPEADQWEGAQEIFLADGALERGEPFVMAFEYNIRDAAGQGEHHEEFIHNFFMAAHCMTHYEAALNLLIRVSEAKTRCVRSAGLAGDLGQTMADYRDAHNAIQTFLKDVEALNNDIEDLVKHARREAQQYAEEGIPGASNLIDELTIELLAQQKRIDELKTDCATLLGHLDDLAALGYDLNQDDKTVQGDIARRLTKDQS